MLQKTVPMVPVMLADKGMLACGAIVRIEYCRDRIGRRIGASSDGGNNG